MKAYRADVRMDAAKAERFHHAQIEVFRNTEADMISAVTITYSAEATGIVRAAQACGLPVVISSTVETDGRLPLGEMLAEAIGQVNAAAGNGQPITWQAVPTLRVVDRNHCGRSPPFIAIRAADDCGPLHLASAG